MERNTLLAIILSAVILFAYQAFFVPPKPTTVVNAQLRQTAVVKNTPESPSHVKYSEPTKAVKKSINYKIEAINSIFSYSDVGGLLHKIDFLGNVPFPIEDVVTINGFNNVSYDGKKLNDKTIYFSYKGREWQIAKTYSMKDGNLINIRMEIKNVSKISILTDFVIKTFEINQSDVSPKDGRQNGLNEYSIYGDNKILLRRDNAVKFNDKNDNNGTAKIGWVGFRDHYQALIVKPKFAASFYKIKAVNDKQLNIYIKPKGINLAPGQSVAYDFDVYAGPQNPWLMKKYGDDFEKIIVFSKFWFYEWPAQLIYHLIYVFHGIFKSWGIAIILMGITFYAAAYPLTMKSMVSMRKMQEIQPKVKALQEKYKNDPQKAQAEMMELYRREKINPMSGCLPFLIQMPFFYALLQIMWRAQYFQGQHFLWIKDLTEPDRLIILPFSLPFFGNEVNILPIITGILFYVQQVISSKNTVATDEQQVMQQKMMRYFLPIMMTVMFYKFASAWALYFLVYYTFATITQWKISKLPKK
ncbi:MAG: membrane protein insertase YidC [Candidatus Omnitrophica bacterium]|nr:membrane protein insertase YidC [Candidatus Omnitrophota bacterium]